MGTDLSVVNAARVSFDKVSEWDTEPRTSEVIDGKMYFRDFPPPNTLKPEDAKLIHYLARGMSSKAREQILQEALEADTREVLLDCLARLDVDTHWTPFAHTSISLRMQAPVPIRTQCFKHKQGLVENEESRRYISSTPKLFVPDEFRMAPTNGAKQGSSGTHAASNEWLGVYTVHAMRMIDLYNEMIEDGVCPEQARFVLPQGCEVQWIWTGNLYAFANFYNKRTDAHAQKEIQDLARMVGDIIEPLFPVSWKALTE
jgi:thymidylate synthase (FAD)